MKRKLALIMAAAMVMSSVPQSSLIAYGEEMIADEGAAEETSAEAQVQELFPEIAAEEAAETAPDVGPEMDSGEYGAFENEDAPVYEEQEAPVDQVGEIESGTDENAGAEQPFADDSGWIESADMQEAGQLAADGEERQTIDYGSTESYFWINAGEGVTLTPVLLGTASDDYRYEWYSVDEQGEGTRIEGAVSDTYETGALLRNAAYEFQIVRNADDVCVEGVGFWVNVDSLTVGDIEISKEAVYGQPVTLSVEASSAIPDAQLTYRWTCNLIGADGEYMGEELLQEGSEASCTISKLTGRGDFRCEVSDGNVTKQTSIWLSVSSLVVEDEMEFRKSQDPVYAEPLTLYVDARSLAEDAVLNYQWYVYEQDEEENAERVVLQDGPDNFYTIPSVTESRYYYCLVSDGINSCGIADWIRVPTLTAGEIVTSGETVYGEPLILSVEASSTLGSDALTYQWHYYDEEGEKVILQDDKESSYRIPSVTETRTYYCMVSDGVNDDTISREIWVDTLTITGSTWQEKSVMPNETVTLTVNASSAVGEVRYQWYRWGGSEEAPRIEIEGATEASWTSEPVTDRVQYYCNVSDGVDSRWIIYVISVSSKLRASAESDTITVLPGESATLKVNVTTLSDREISYHWYRNGDEEPIADETGSELVLNDIQKSANYFCRILDGYEWDSVYIDVCVDSGFSCKPSSADSISLKPGESFLMTVAASSRIGALTYEWSYEEESYSEENDCWEYAYVPLDSDTNVLYLTDIRESRSIRCYVSDGYNDAEIWFYIEVTESAFGVDLEYDGQIFADPAEGADLFVRAPEGAEITYEWFSIDGCGDYYPIAGANASVLHRTPEELKKCREYSCLVRDENGNQVSCYMEVIVKTTLNIDVSGYEDWRDGIVSIRKPENESAELTVVASSDCGTLRYQWFRGIEDEEYGDVEWSILETETEHALTVSECGMYRCEVSDGSSREPLTFRVTESAEFRLFAPAVVQADQNGNAVLQTSCLVPEAGTVTYRWFGGRGTGETGYGTVLEGETGSSLKVSGIEKPTLYTARAYLNYTEDAYGDWEYDASENCMILVVPKDMEEPDSPDRAVLLSVGYSYGRISQGSDSRYYYRFQAEERAEYSFRLGSMSYNETAKNYCHYDKAGNVIRKGAFLYSLNEYLDEGDYIVFSLEKLSPWSGCEDLLEIRVYNNGHSHHWDDGTVTGATVCGSEAQRVFHCTDRGCDETVTMRTVADHVYTEYVYNNDATCIQDGTETAACQCGQTTDTRVLEGSKVPHSFTTYVSDGNATCTKDGTKTAVCDNCDATDTVADEGTRIDHVFSDEWICLVEPTCITEGVLGQECTAEDCDAMNTKTIPATGHQFEGQETIVEPATEEKNGKEYRKCAKCDAISVDKILLRSEEQEKINALDSLVNGEGGQASASEIVEQITKIDNQALIDGGQKELLDRIEEQIVQETASENEPTVGETKIDSSAGAVSGNVSASGAAVSVAAAIEASKETEGNPFEAGELYHAQICVVPVSTEETSAYQLDISLNIVDSTNTVVKEDAPLAAPITITIPVPASYQDVAFVLYHVTDQGKVQIPYTDNMDGTITFVTPSLSPFILKADLCVNGHVNAEELEWTTVKAATCTETGSEEAVCTRCEGKLSRVTTALGHAFDTEYTVDQKPDCVNSGSKSRHCSRCEEKTDITPIDPLGHDPKDVKGKEATCTEPGLTAGSVCNRCETVLEEQKGIPETGHDWGAWETTKKAGFTENGKLTRVCANDGKHVETQTIYSLSSSASAYTLSATSYKYNGKVQRPTVKSVKDSKGKVISSSNYTVSYSSGCINAGTYSVYVKFKGNYSGTKTLKYTIAKATQTITASNQTKTLGAALFSLGAKRTSGGGTLSYKSSNTAVAAVSSKGNVQVKSVAAATITITAASNTNYHAATKKITVTVLPKGTAISGLANTAARRLTVSWKRNSAVTGYQIQYATSKAFSGAKTVTVRPNTKIATYISGLVKGKGYYVRIRTYKTVGSKNYYSAWSPYKGIVIKK